VTLTTRSLFIARLEGKDPDSQEIRSHIATLHRHLSDDPLEDTKKRRISFEKVLIGKNTKRCPNKNWPLDLPGGTNHFMPKCRLDDNEQPRKRLSNNYPDSGLEH
jgi:hypothetical protein